MRAGHQPDATKRPKPGAGSRTTGAKGTVATPPAAQVLRCSGAQVLSIADVGRIGGGKPVFSKVFNWM